MIAVQALNSIPPGKRHDSLYSVKFPLLKTREDRLQFHCFAFKYQMKVLLKVLI